MATSTLSYYFNKETSFNYEPTTNILNQSNSTGVSIPITLLNNNSSLSVMSIMNNSESIASYYTLNKIFLSGTSVFSTLNQDNTVSQNKPTGSNYQLILQGYLNDYNHNQNNQNNQILIILPIFTNVSNTKQGNNNSVTNLNNAYLNDLLNISIGNTNNVVNGIDINEFLSGATSANFYKNVMNDKITYTIVHFGKTNLWANIRLPSNITLTSPFIPSTIPTTISVRNNGNIIKTAMANDIYIDCSPTNNVGESVAVYTSKNLDQLNFFQIDNLDVWGGFLLAIVILFVVVFGAIKMFQFSEDTPIDLNKSQSR